MPPIYAALLAASACAWSAAAFSSLLSPCLPFCPCRQSPCVSLPTSLFFFLSSLVVCKLTSHLANLNSLSPLLSATMRFSSWSERRTTRDATAT